LRQWELTFEIHLPEFIWSRPLEAHKGLMLGRLLGSSN
jgi:hypothetical protein